MLRKTLAFTLLTATFAVLIQSLWPTGHYAPHIVQRAKAEDAASKADPSPNRATATFAAGCYWCVESDFDKVKGVVATISGFMGGTTRNPTYRSVTYGNTGHLEVVQVTYDPKKVSYQQLLDYYWRHVDPLDGGGQFCDRGASYRPAIFVHDATQRRLAKASKAKVAARFKSPIAVKIRNASKFTRGPTYHQNYYLKEPYKYKRYRYGCGRDQRLRQLWGHKGS